MVHKMQRLALTNANASTGTSKSTNMEVDGQKCDTIEEEPEVDGIGNAEVQQGTLAWVTGCLSPYNCVMSMSMLLFDLVFKYIDVLSSTVQILISIFFLRFIFVFFVPVPNHTRYVK